MKVYVFTGDRGEILGREPLAHGDAIELTDADAEYLIVDQRFPLIPAVSESEKSESEKRATPAEEAK